MEIHWVHAGNISEEQRRLAEERIRSLGAGQSDLIDVRITARTTGHHKHGDKELIGHSSGLFAMSDKYEFGQQTPK